MTPLMHASAMGFVEAIKWLLLPRSLQDKRTARPDVTDHKGWTALFYATQCRVRGRAGAQLHTRRHRMWFTTVLVVCLVIAGRGAYAACAA